MLRITLGSIMDHTFGTFFYTIWLLKKSPLQRAVYLLVNLKGDINLLHLYLDHYYNCSICP